MALNSPLSKALALEPVDVSTPRGDATRALAGETSKANPERDLRMTTVDEFLAAAAKEYEAGKIDQVAWRQAADQCRGDASLAIAAYLRARATALQQRRKAEENPEIKLRGAGSKSSAAQEQVRSDPPAELPSAKLQEATPRRNRPTIMYVAGAAVGLASIAAVAYFIVSPGQVETARQRAPSATPSVSAQATTMRGDQATVEASNASDPRSALRATVAQLKSAGNWNVLVLYATEWTRKEPGNAAAWGELSVGYANLRQYNEALDAAAKAVQFAPGDGATWRNLGQLNLAVDRLPDAAVAFDKALALNPDDTDARCGAALVAQRQARPKDADAIVRRPLSAGSSCVELGGSQSASVPVGTLATGKPAPPAGR